jgi:protein-tyrosine phosphatase
MIDIHCHLVFDVDDGSKSLEQSIKYLKEIKKINLSKVICTPHMKHGKREKALKIVENFKIVREEAKKMGIDLYLGNEIMYSEDTINLLKHKKIATLNNTNYILLEFKRIEDMDIDLMLDILEDIQDEGYQIILAHPELYVNYRNVKDIKKIKELGVLLQMDATSILKKKTNKKVYKFSKKLLKLHLIDIVASDSHCSKKRDFKSFLMAYKKIKRKYGKQYAEYLFKQNAKEIIE